MTKEQALHSFWSQFGLTAYEETSVPSRDGAEYAPKFPYITYQTATDYFGYPVALSASLWYRSESWNAINTKTEEIARKIGRGGTLVPCDGGMLWITPGTPFAQNMSDPTDDAIRRKYINISVEFIIG